jgi:hypothetical protein
MVSPFKNSFIHRETSSPVVKNKEQQHGHAEIRTVLVRKIPETMIFQDRDFRCDKSSDHNNEQRNSSKPAKEP